MLFVVVCLLIFAVYASADVGSGVYVKALCRVKTERRAVALTFDDGPDPLQTPRVLEVLERNNTRATFFCVGSRAERYPDLVRRIVAQGHTIGNHSYGHNARFPMLGKAAMRGDLERCSEVLERITGHQPRWFRPPFGVTNPTVTHAVKRLRMATIGWSIRSMDTMGWERDRVVRRVIGRLRPGAIILLHDDRQGSELLLQALITEIRKKGYEIESLDNLLTNP